MIDIGIIDHTYYGLWVNQHLGCVLVLIAWIQKHGTEVHDKNKTAIIIISVMSM